MACLLGATVACSSDRGSATGSSAIDVPAAAIDTGATFEDLEPGRRTALFVEYASGGHWRAFVSCDTSRSEAPCEWDVIASSAHPLTDIELGHASGGGWTEPSPAADEGSVLSGIRFVASTTTDLEGVRFTTTPGAAVRLDVVLDGVPEGRFLHWVGGGAIHRGAPVSILDLVPTAP